MASNNYAVEGRLSSQNTKLSFKVYRLPKRFNKLALYASNPISQFMFIGFTENQRNLSSQKGVSAWKSNGLEKK